MAAVIIIEALRHEPKKNYISCALCTHAFSHPHHKYSFSLHINILTQRTQYYVYLNCSETARQKQSLNTNKPDEHLSWLMSINAFFFFLSVCSSGNSEAYCMYTYSDDFIWLNHINIQTNEREESHNTNHWLIEIIGFIQNSNKNQRRAHEDISDSSCVLFIHIQAFGNQKIIVHSVFSCSFNVFCGMNYWLLGIVIHFDYFQFASYYGV